MVLVAGSWSACAAWPGWWVPACGRLDAAGHTTRMREKNPGVGMTSPILIVGAPLRSAGHRRRGVAAQRPVVAWPATRSARAWRRPSGADLRAARLGGVEARRARLAAALPPGAGHPRGDGPSVASAPRCLRQPARPCAARSTETSAHCVRPTCCHCGREPAGRRYCGGRAGRRQPLAGTALSIAPPRCRWARVLPTKR